MNILTCPSDTQNDAVPIQASTGTGTWSFNTVANRGYTLPPGNWLQYFSSYAGCAGTYDFGYNTTYSAAEFAEYNGVIYNDSTVRIAMVTDGTSNTFMFGEHSKAYAVINDPGYFTSDNSWNSGRWYDTLMSTFYPIDINLGAGPGP